MHASKGQSTSYGPDGRKSCDTLQVTKIKVTIYTLMEGDPVA